MLNFQVKFWTDRLTDRKADRRTPVKQCAADLSMRGHKKRHNCDRTKAITKSHPFPNNKF